MFSWGEYLGNPECPYMRRWALGRLRLHHWYHSDEKRFMHDHPSSFITLVLKGRYIDTHAVIKNGKPLPYPTKLDYLGPGSIRYRSAHHIHYVDVQEGGCWTLLWFGKKSRKWGFWVPRKSDGVLRFKKSNKFHIEYGHPPCDDS